MELLEAIVLGIIQGITEFLPVSSSGHLEIAKWLLGDDVNAQQSMFMTVLLHFATALSTLVYFRSFIWSILTKRKVQYVLWIIVSMVPAVFVGLFFDEFIESLFSRNILLVACMLMVTGVLLFVSERNFLGDQRLGYGRALIIGIAQAIAILPGISRSGATISAALLLGIERTEAATFSFLMVIPLIFGKMCQDAISQDIVITEPLSYYAAGFLAAFIAGLLACGFMVNIVKRAKLSYFAIYCFLVAFAIFLAILLG